MTQKTNVEKLEDAGLLGSAPPLSQEQIDAIECLTNAEVNALISASQKLGLTGTMNQDLQSRGY